MNCTPKVRQKKSNFWGAVHLQSFSFTRENLKNSRIALNQHFQKFSLYGRISLLGQFKIRNSFLVYCARFFINTSTLTKDVP